MSSTTQISAHISGGLKDRMERYVRQSGVTRTRLLEDALAYHLTALEELPPDIIVPARLVLSSDSADPVKNALTHPPEPTDDMKQLFDDR